MFFHTVLHGIDLIKTHCHMDTSVHRRLFFKRHFRVCCTTQLFPSDVWLYVCVLVCLALIVFTDGRYIGSVLDRNGLRPSRFYVSKSNFMYMASEVGVANVAPDEVIQKHRLKPGRLLLVDTKQGVFVRDDIIKEQIATLRPVASWIEQEVGLLRSVWLQLSVVNRGVLNKRWVYSTQSGFSCLSLTEVC